MSDEGMNLSTIPFNDEWENFIDSMPNATIFHHPSWLNTIAQVYGYKCEGFVLRDSYGKISAALPVAFVDSLLTGRRWIAYPFSDYCFPLYRTESDLDMLIKSLLQFCGEEKIDPFEIRWNLPKSNEVQAYPEAVLHLKKLESDIDKVAASIHPMHRRNIRQSENRGVRVEWGKSRQDLQTFYHLHLETRRRQGVPVQPWKFFEQLIKNVIETGHGFILLAYHENQCLAGALFLYHNKTVTYKYGASIHDQLNLRPNNLIFWKAIQWACENDFTLFDFGKTDHKNIGLREFKSKWGSEEQTLVYSFLSTKPVHAGTGRLNKIVEGIIKKSPLWVCRSSGELLYKHFA